MFPQEGADDDKGGGGGMMLSARLAAQSVQGWQIGCGP